MHYRQTKKLDSLDGLEQLEINESTTEEISESVRKVKEILKDIPLKQQEIFQLREMEGLSYEEIAAHLELPLEQVKVNLHRARKSIRERMINQSKTK